MEGWAARVDLVAVPVQCSGRMSYLTPIYARKRRIHRKYPAMATKFLASRGYPSASSSSLEDDSSMAEEEETQSSSGEGQEWRRPPQSPKPPPSSPPRKQAQFQKHTSNTPALTSLQPESDSETEPHYETESNSETNSDSEAEPTRQPESMSAIQSTTSPWKPKAKKPIHTPAKFTEYSHAGTLNPRSKSKEAQIESPKMKSKYNLKPIAASEEKAKGRESGGTDWDLKDLKSTSKPTATASAEKLNGKRVREKDGDTKNSKSETRKDLKLDRSSAMNGALLKQLLSDDQKLAFNDFVMKWGMEVVSPSERKEIVDEWRKLYLEEFGLDSRRYQLMRRHAVNILEFLAIAKK